MGKLVAAWLDRALSGKRWNPAAFPSDLTCTAQHYYVDYWGRLSEKSYAVQEFRFLIQPGLVTRQRRIHPLETKHLLFFIYLPFHFPLHVLSPMFSSCCICSFPLFGTDTEMPFSCCSSFCLAARPQPLTFAVVGLI